jgi:DNA polymerase-3 subunit delta'
MRFKEIIGQEELKQKFTGMLRSGKFPHALMLTGPTGNGGLPLALAIAQYLQCENRQEDDSCGECPSCTKNKKFIHPDLYFTFPVVKPEKKTGPPVSGDYMKEWRIAITENPYLNYNDWMQAIGAENRQGNITADECRQIINHLSLKTYESSYKVQIIWLAEFLGNEGNILLKVIEEPPADTLFILLVENTEQVLNTILSRTQIVKVNPIEEEAIVAELVTRFGSDAEVAKRIARIADGNFDTASIIAAGEEKLNDRLLHKWLVSCFNLKLKPSAGNTQTLVDWIEDFAKAGRENQKVFLKYALFFLRECSLIGITGLSEKLEEEELTFASRLSARLNVEQLEALAAIFNRMYYHVERNANPKILFMSNSFKIASVFAGEEVVSE